MNEKSNEDRDQRVESISAAYAVLFLVAAIFIAVGYGMYKVSDGLPGLMVLLGDKGNSSVLSGQDSPLEINYSLEEDENGEFRLTCAGNLSGFGEAVRIYNGEYIEGYQMAIAAAAVSDEEALNDAVDTMSDAVNRIDNLPIPSCVTFMDTLAGSHKMLFDGLLAFIDVINAVDQEEGSEALALWRQSNDAGYVSNGFFIGQLSLTSELVEGVE